MEVSTKIKIKMITKDLQGNSNINKYTCFVDKCFILFFTILDKSQKRMAIRIEGSTLKRKFCSQLSVF